MNDDSGQRHLGEAIASWREARIITGDQAAKILSHERDRGVGVDLAPAGAKPAGRRAAGAAAWLDHLVHRGLPDPLCPDDLHRVRLGFDEQGDAVLLGTRRRRRVLGAGFALRRFPPARLGGNLLVFAGAGALPLLIYTFQRLVGWWPGEPALEYEDFHHRVLAVGVGMELVSMAGAIVLAYRTRFPLLMLLAGFWGWYLAMDLTRWVRGDDHDFWSEDHHWVGFLIGVLIVGAGLELARRHLRSYGFWLILFGNLAWMAHLGDIALDDDFGAASVLFLLISLAAIVASVLTQFRVFLVFGALGLYSWVCYLVFDTFDDSSSVTLGLVLVGTFIVLTGVGYQKWLEPALERWARDWRARNQEGSPMQP